ncbi:MAG: hypothetical protein AAFY02_02805 [Pseudomonadota bacterium]
MNILGKLFFGGSLSLEWLDQGLESSGLAPGGFPEPLRLAMVRLTKDALDLPQRGEPKGLARQQLVEALSRSGRLFAYCYQGSRDFTDREGPEIAAEMEARLTNALDAPEGLDARIISLTLLSGYAHGEVAARFETEEQAESS